MLSKTKILVTPKRINSEVDNAKSNEAKADKDKRELEEEDRKRYIEFLQNEKLHILGNMDVFKRSVADIETQEEEINREVLDYFVLLSLIHQNVLLKIRKIMMYVYFQLELERALLTAESESESLKLSQDEAEKVRVQRQISELEHDMNEDNIAQTTLQEEARQRVEQAQQMCYSLEDELAKCKTCREREQLSSKLNAQQDVLESEKKAFEDLEFHHLEQEASKLATREELQRSFQQHSTLF